MGQAVTLRRYGVRFGDLQPTCRDDAGIDRGGVGTRNRVAILVYGPVY